MNKRKINSSAANRLDDGARGEELAVSFLVSRGARILCRNYRTPSGEIDIIAAIKKDIVFVEVKTRTLTSLLDPLDSITSQKQERLVRTAKHYLFAKDPNFCSCRIDAIAILLTVKKEIFLIRHIKNIITL